jgi:hypothetical protein
MARYHANIDQEKKESFNDVPSEKEMSKYKDFGKLTHNYQRMTKPLYKRPIYRYRNGFLMILLILLLLYLIIEFG